jgi:hypothetical protein
MTKPRKRPARAILNEDSYFSIETLRDLLREKVLSDRLNMPSDDALAQLARVLERWRAHYVNEQKRYQPLRELQNDARDSAEQLRAAVSVLKTATEEFHGTAVLESASLSVLNILKTRLAEIDDAQQFLDRFERASILDDRGIGAAIGWQWLAEVLPLDFKSAMTSTNQDFKAGIGHDGPLTRFIAAIVPNLTGEHPTSDSVATLLKARRNKVA